MIRINPVRATREKYKYNNCQMMDVNNTCYEIVAAFNGSTDPYNLDPALTKDCDDYIEQRRYDIYGVGHCDHQAPYKPVIWNEVPNFVPDLLRQGASPEQALQRGMELCKKYVPTLVNECQEKCKLHYSAIEKYDKPDFSPRLGSGSTNSGSGSTSSSKTELWVGISVLIVGLVLAGILVYKARLDKINGANQV